MSKKSYSDNKNIVSGCFFALMGVLTTATSAWIWKSSEGTSGDQAFCGTLGLCGVITCNNASDIANRLWKWIDYKPHVEMSGEYHSTE